MCSFLAHGHENRGSYRLSMYYYDVAHSNALHDRRLRVCLHVAYPLTKHGEPSTTPINNNCNGHIGNSRQNSVAVVVTTTLSRPHEGEFC